MKREDVRPRKTKEQNERMIIEVSVLGHSTKKKQIKRKSVCYDIFF